MKNTKKMNSASGSSRRKGSVAVFVALGFVMICGFAAFATDYGQLVWTRNQLQKSCDAAAISGASQLPNTTSAQSVALTVAGQNNVPSPSVGWPGGVSKIQVSASKEVSYGFAKVIGLRSGNVSATAVAGRIPLKGVGGNVPLAITTDDYNNYAPAGMPRVETGSTWTSTGPTGGPQSAASFELELVDNNRQNFFAGDVTALDVRPENSSKSGPVFQEDLTYGFSGTLSFGDQVNVLNASLTSQGPNLMQAMRDRIAQSAASPYLNTGSNYTFPNYPAGDPRIMTLVVADPHPADNNNPVVTVRRLVPVYVESVRDPGRAGYFLRLRILPGKLYNAETPGIVFGDETTPDSGLAVVRLLS